MDTVELAGRSVSDHSLLGQVRPPTKNSAAKDSNILKRQVQNSNQNHAVRRRRPEGTSGKYTKAQVQVSVRTNDTASLGRACSFDVWTTRT